MANVSLHPIWPTLMPAYEHGVFIATHSVSALAIYLIITKTPPIGRPFAKYLLLLQVLVTFVDFDFGFLFCPLPLYPAPGALCYGVLCTVFTASGHFGMLLLVFAFGYVGVAITYCFHFKFLVICKMTHHQTIFKQFSIVFRIIIFIIFTVPGLSFYRTVTNVRSGPEYIRMKYPSLSYLFEDKSNHAFIYDTAIRPSKTILFASASLFVMFCAIAINGFFVFSSSFLLIRQGAQLSKRTIQLQRSGLRLLLIQVHVPLIMLLVPLGVQAYSLLADTLNPDINNIIFCFEITHGFVHTAVIILSTPSYREQLMFWRGKKTGHALTTFVLPSD